MSPACYHCTTPQKTPRRAGPEEERRRGAASREPPGDEMSPTTSVRACKGKSALRLRDVLERIDPPQLECILERDRDPDEIALVHGLHARDDLRREPGLTHAPDPPAVIALRVLRSREPEAERLLVLHDLVAGTSFGSVGSGGIRPPAWRH